MTTETLIHELEKLTLSEKLLVIEKTLTSIRMERENSLKAAVDLINKDYDTDNELISFTLLDNEPFYEPR